MQVLSGDIGGTKTRLAYYSIEGNKLTAIAEAEWRSQHYSDLESLIKTFFEQFSITPQEIDAAGFGVPGPVIGGICDVTNLPWVIDEENIKQVFGISNVWLLNDLEANAWGIDVLEEKDFSTLNVGIRQAGNASVIAAGTGLGQAGMYWDGVQHKPFASEGGHTDFAPETEQEFRLLLWLKQQYGHVSWERIVSGEGLINLYRFLCIDRGFDEPDWFKPGSSECDAAAEITINARKGDTLCGEALDWFICLYGREAGNHALKLLSRGGVYIGGGIAPKIINWMNKPGFIENFLAKGRMRRLLADMPVKVILNDKTALFGPALFAQNKLSGGGK